MPGMLSFCNLLAASMQCYTNWYSSAKPTCQSIAKLLELYAETHNVATTEPINRICSRKFGNETHTKEKVVSCRTRKGTRDCGWWIDAVGNRTGELLPCRFCPRTHKNKWARSIDHRRASASVHGRSCVSLDLQMHGRRFWQRCRVSRFLGCERHLLWLLHEKHSTTSTKRHFRSLLNFPLGHERERREEKRREEKRREEKHPLVSTCMQVTNRILCARSLCRTAECCMQLRRCVYSTVVQGFNFVFHQTVDLLRRTTNLHCIV